VTDHPAERLSAFLDAELPEAEAREIQEHLEGCPACRSQLAELALVGDAARQLGVSAPDGYFEALPGRIRRRLRPRRLAAPPVWAWAAAAAVLLAVLTPLVGRDPFATRRASTPLPQTAHARTRSALPEAPAPAPASQVKERASPRPGPPASPPPPAAQGRLAKAKPAAPPATRDEPTPQGSSLEPVGEFKAEAGPAPGQASGFAAPPGVAAPAPAPKELSAETAAPEGAARKPGLASRADAKLRQADRLQAQASAGAEDEEYDNLRSRRPTTAQEARALREGWRRLAPRLGSDRRLDQARLAVIEASATAWRLGRDPDDLAQLRADAEEYLARPDARHAERVRALLRSLEESR
jgi:Putative zinc-finger